MRCVPALLITIFSLIAPAGICAVALAAPALALDCARAAAPVDKAICAAPAAAAADEAMTSAYEALRARLAEPQKEALLISQRRWLRRRADLCLADDGAAALTSCLAAETQRRRAYLSGAAEGGPGAGQALTPVFIQHVGKPYQYDLDVNALKFTDPQSPGERLFNARVDALLKAVPGVDQTEYRQDMVYTYDLDVSATFASPRLIAARVETYDFSGGAHGNSGVENFAIDVAAGRALDFYDLFEAGAKAPLVRACLAGIARQKREKAPDDPFGVVSAADQKKAIEESVSDLSRWSLYATGAKITFDPYALGAYVEGSYDCDFSAALLRPLLKLDYLAP